MKRTFTTSVSFKCENAAQASKLFSAMKELGYKDDTVHGWTTIYSYITNKYNNRLGEIGFLDEERGILANSEEEFLAIAAMSAGNDFYKGEWVVCLKSYSDQFTKDKLYQLQEDCLYSTLSIAKDDLDSTTNGWGKEFFRKAKIEELQNKFNQNKMTNQTQLPTKWYVKVTEENKPILADWIKKQPNFSKGYLIANYFVLSDRYDGSYQFWGSDEKDVISIGYSKITFQQFEELVLGKKDDKKILGYKTSTELFNGKVKKGTIYYPYSDTITNFYCPNHDDLPSNVAPIF